MISITKTIKQENTRTLIVRDGADYAGKAVWQTDGGTVYALFMLEHVPKKDLAEIIPAVLHEMISTDHEDLLRR